VEQKGREQHGHLKGRKSNCYERGTRVDVSGIWRERKGESVLYKIVPSSVCLSPGMLDPLHSLSSLLVCVLPGREREDEENSGVKEEEEVARSDRACVTV